MKRAPARFGLVALLVAWAVDLLFWQKAPGLSFPLWVALALIGCLLLAGSLKVRLSKYSLGLIAATLIFASLTFLRREAFTQFISVLLCFFSLVLLAATFQTGNWFYYKIEDYLKAGGKLLLAWLIRPADLLSPVTPVQSPALLQIAVIEISAVGASGAEAVLVSGPTPQLPPTPQRTPAIETSRSRAAAQSLPVIRGLFLALPVVLVLGSLLASADPIFNNWVRDLFKNFDGAHLPEYLYRLMYIVIIAYGLTGTYLHAICPSQVEARPTPGQRWFAPFLGWVETVIVLGAVNLLFIVFVAIQFWYLFGGQANISTSGFTYSEYARRGFNELVAVALLSLLLYLGLATITKQETALHRTSLVVLNVLLIAQVLVILVSSFSRLTLYENAYGFTQLRTYTHIFILWLGGLLALTIGLELIRRRDRFALAALLVCFGFGLTFGLLNVDGFIASQNIQRAWTGGKLDGQYLTMLSDDAVPVLVEEVRRANQPAAVREIIGAELACRDAAFQENGVSDSWLSYNLSQANAAELLRSNRTLWQAYPVQSNDLGRVAVLPIGNHNCQGIQNID